MNPDLKKQLAEMELFDLLQLLSTGAEKHSLEVLKAAEEELAGRKIFESVFGESVKKDQPEPVVPSITNSFALRAGVIGFVALVVLILCLLQFCH
jgi:hypothetical protein